MFSNGWLLIEQFPICRPCSVPSPSATMISLCIEQVTMSHAEAHQLLTEADYLRFEESAVLRHEPGSVMASRVNDNRRIASADFFIFCADFSNAS